MKSSEARILAVMNETFCSCKLGSYNNKNLMYYDDCPFKTKIEISCGTLGFIFITAPKLSNNHLYKVV